VNDTPTPKQDQSERAREFERLAADCRRNAYALAYHLLSDAAEAEDVTQEGFVRAWQHFNAYDPDRSFEAWMMRIVRNLAIDAYRRRKRQGLVSLEATRRAEEDGPWLAAALANRQADPQAAALSRAGHEQLLQAMTHLSAVHREVLWRLHIEEDSYKALADRLGCPIGTVRSRVYRARKAAREALAQNGFPDGVQAGA
jgi:RNA polymerase sigma-70 factor (ECF subfamily)